MPLRAPPSHTPFALAVAMLLVAPACAAVEPAKPPADGLSLEWNARLRIERVDDDAFADGADATTLRLRAGLRWRGEAGISALLEGDAIAGAGAYNSGANGDVARPAITDAEGAGLNQAFVAWRGADVGATLGRQRLQFDNQRWVGNSGWRQHEQTFDALAVDWHPSASLAARYAFVSRVHRVNGDDALDRLARGRALSTHLLDIAWTRGAQQLTGYAYLHDDRDLASASTQTLGLRWTGSHRQGDRGPGWTLEAARQRDWAGNPQSFAHTYWLLEPTYAVHGVTWRAGWEHLGGDGTHALQTPLATLHAFDGWADKFTVTPPGGLEDRYAGAEGGFGHSSGKLKWALAWHDFRANRGPRYGSEWDASLAFPVHGALGGLVKLADYRSDGFARDTRKLWLQLEWAGPP